MAKLGSPPHPPVMEQVLGGRECSSKAPCEAPVVLERLAGEVWSLLPASHFWEMNVLGWIFIYFKIFFFPLPLGVEQKGVCWFINIPSLAEQGNPSLIRP